MNSGGRAPERRHDPLTGRWVIVAAGRRRRPRADAPRAAPLPSYVADCPFCPGNEASTPAPLLVRSDASGAWQVRVVPNLYPAVVERGLGVPTGEPPFVARAATGAHEVIIETPGHDEELAGRDPARALEMLAAAQERVSALLARRGTRHVLLFKNRGRDAGTSLEHPHSQIVAVDFLPGEVAATTRNARHYYRRTRRCLLCSLVAAERQAGERVVFEQDGFVAYAPYASLSAGAVLLAPLAHAASFTEATPSSLAGLARALVRLLAACRDAFGDPAYNLVLQAPSKRGLGDPALHWYWQLAPRLTRTAGFELGSGIEINPYAPEEVAALLRGHV